MFLELFVEHSSDLDVSTLVEASAAGASAKPASGSSLVKLPYLSIELTVPFVLTPFLAADTFVLP
jgi:hypothetical protein